MTREEVVVQAVVARRVVVQPATSVECGFMNGVWRSSKGVTETVPVTRLWTNAPPLDRLFD